MLNTRTLKIALLVAAAAVVVWLLLAVDDERQLRISTSSPLGGVDTPVATAGQLAAATSTTTVLVKPRYTGEDSAGYMWEVTANSASQSGSAVSSTLELATVRAVWQQGEAYTLAADTGSYLMDNKQLEVAGNVILTGQGLTLTLPRAVADMATRQVDGSGGIRLQGRLGGFDAVLTATAFSLTGNANKLAFSGSVHVVLSE